MNTGSKLYQELELIPESAYSLHKVHFLVRLFAPIRRSLANAFVKDLSNKHRALLFKRCYELGKTELQIPEIPQQSPQALEARKYGRSPSLERFRQEQNLRAQQWINRGGMPWWAWYDS